VVAVRPSCHTPDTLHVTHSYITHSCSSPTSRRRRSRRTKTSRKAFPFTGSACKRDIPVRCQVAEIGSPNVAGHEDLSHIGGSKNAELVLPIKKLTAEHAEIADMQIGGPICILPSSAPSPSRTRGPIFGSGNLLDSFLRCIALSVRSLPVSNASLQMDPRVREGDERRRAPRRCEKFPCRLIACCNRATSPVASLTTSPMGEVFGARARRDPKARGLRLGASDRMARPRLLRPATRQSRITAAELAACDRMARSRLLRRTTR
jgi:hypothetical protein